jgi:hypothetical protein
MRIAAASGMFVLFYAASLITVHGGPAELKRISSLALEMIGFRQYRATLDKRGVYPVQHTELAKADLSS